MSPASSSSSTSSMAGGSVDSPATVLSRQASHPAAINGDIGRVIELVRNAETNTNSNRFSLRSDSDSSFRTRGSIEDADLESNSDFQEMEPTHVNLILNGNREQILTSGVNLWQLKSLEDGNSALHIAAANSSQSQLISDIIPISKGIIKWKNKKGDLAFHAAAKAEKLDCLKALCDWASYESEETEIDVKLLGSTNIEGDTPLHIALENNEKEMAMFLANQYPEACYMLNKRDETPIYLSVKAGFWDLVERMIELIKEQSVDIEDALLLGESVVHAVLEAENSDILKKILKTFAKLIKSYDKEGRTPLSFAAFKGYLEGVQYLLDKFPDSAYMLDKDGSFPIHQAASGGHIKVITELHSTKHLLNRKGQNILHVAAANGKSEVVTHLLKTKELWQFTNVKDEDGSTPLHLATLGFHPRVVYILTREKKVKLDLKNKHGLTALDLAEINAGPNPTFEARLTWMALRYINAPRSSQSTRKSYAETLKQEEQKNQNNYQINKNNIPNNRKLESYKNRIEAPMLVATLVATVTFAAGFTLPGGFKQDDLQIGMAVLPHKWAFDVFVICNTAAMYSSILAVVTLIWAQMGELKLVLVSLRFALPVLGFSLTMMSLAFMMGVYVVLRNVPWLSYLVLGLGSVFLGVVLVFFVPLYNPSYIRNPAVRIFFSGSFLLLLFVCEKTDIEYA